MESFGWYFILSKDSKPNLRDLYKNKGKSIANENKQSKELASERLSSGIGLLFSGSAIAPAIRDKILKLRISDPKTQNISSLPITLTFKSNKSEIHMLLLSFGLNYQRILGSAIPSIQQLYSQFITTYPQILSFSEKDCSDSLRYLHSAGLLYQLNPEILFESLDKSKDINQIFSLLQPTETSLPITRIKSNFPSWSQEKIMNMVNLLIENGLAITDNDTIWFPQLN